MEERRFKRFLTRRPPEMTEGDLRQTVRQQNDYIMWLHEQLEYYLGLLDRQITEIGKKE